MKYPLKRMKDSGQRLGESVCKPHNRYEYVKKTQTRQYDLYKEPERGSGLSGDPGARDARRGAGCRGCSGVCVFPALLLGERCGPATPWAACSPVLGGRQEGVGRAGWGRVGRSPALQSFSVCHLIYWPISYKFILFKLEFMYNRACYRGTIEWLTMFKGDIPLIVIINHCIYSPRCTIHSCSWFYTR